MRSSRRQGAAQMTDPPLSRTDLLMPVPEDKAIHLLEIEALRGIADTLKSFRDDAKEDRKLLMDVHTRVVRIEAAKVEELIGPLTERVDCLESEKDRREGAAGLINWLIKNWFGVLGLLAVIFTILTANGKLQL